MNRFITGIIMGDWTNYIQLITLIVNSSLLMIAVKLTRHITGLEFKVDMMWEFFKREFGHKARTTPRDK